jgi:hypothetical protein
MAYSMAYGVAQNVVLYLARNTQPFQSVVQRRIAASGAPPPFSQKEIHV